MRPNTAFFVCKAQKMEPSTDDKLYFIGGVARKCNTSLNFILIQLYFLLQLLKIDRGFLS